ncbi:DUF6221 family protein [Roseateles sp.]|uniref:DUF6221 family protein n=1 Tax=Roseateles sp. TaxID=1971397 RepID=UPI002F4187E8
MTDLVARLREAIGETEQVAKDAEQENWRWYAEDKTVMTHGQDGEWEGYRTTGTRADAEHIARHDPTTVIRRCAADRKILDLHGLMPRPLKNGMPTGWACSICDDGEGTYNYPCETVQIVAEFYEVEA